MIDQTYERAACVRTMAHPRIGQEELAEAAGIHPSRLREYEAGLGSLTEPEIGRLAAALNVELGVLTRAERFDVWRGDRPLPFASYGSLLGVPCTGVSRAQTAVFAAFAEESVDALDDKVNTLLSELDLRAHVLMVSPMSVTLIEDNTDTVYESRVLYSATVVYALPEPVHD